MKAYPKIEAVCQRTLDEAKNFKCMDLVQECQSRIIQLRNGKVEEYSFFLWLLNLRDYYKPKETEPELVKELDDILEKVTPWCQVQLPQNW
jgi:hypothetical protein